MSRQVANVDIITDSFEVWLLQTNELLNAFSTEIITANTTYANTGNSAIARTAQLWGTFGANNVVVTNELRGGNVTGGSANLLITTNTSVSGTLSISGTTTFRSDYVVDVASNTNVGVTIGPVLIYQFPKATYSSGKFEIQVKNGNTQISELVLAHDGGSNAFVTVYGTVASNGAPSPLGTFSANTNTANVNLYLVQNHMILNI
jgi:hypothetical protein